MTSLQTHVKANQSSAMTLPSIYSISKIIQTTWCHYCLHDFPETNKGNKDNGCHQWVFHFQMAGHQETTFTKITAFIFCSPLVNPNFQHRYFRLLNTVFDRITSSCHLHLETIQHNHWYDLYIQCCRWGWNIDIGLSSPSLVLWTGNCVSSTASISCSRLLKTTRTDASGHLHAKTKPKCLSCLSNKDIGLFNLIEVHYTKIPSFFFTESRWA